MWLALAALAMLALAKGAGASLPKGGKDYEGIAREVEAAGASSGWGKFLQAVAHHESRGVITSTRKTKGERKGATDVYVAKLDRFASCPWPASAYTWGSGGWFAMLPANGLTAFFDTPLVCELDPRTMHLDPKASTVMALGFAQRCMRRGSFKDKPTWRTLNRCWAGGSYMDGTPASKVASIDAKFLKALRALGIPESFADRKVNKLPDGWTPFGAYMLGDSHGTT